jgi:hypothetical protein
MTQAIRSHLHKLLFFAALSAADLVMTWYLVDRSGGDVYESNPVANAWLTAYGWVGLVAFKAAMVLLITSIILVISLYRPKTGGRLLGFACLVTGLVVGYSGYLTRFTGAAPLLQAAEGSAEESEHFWNLIKERYQHEQQLATQLAQDLIARRVTVAEVAYRARRTSPNLVSPVDLFVARVVARSQAVLARRGGVPPAEARSAQLEADFQTSLGKPLPAGWVRRGYLARRLAGREAGPKSRFTHPPFLWIPG